MKRLKQRISQSRRREYDRHRFEVQQARQAQQLKHAIEANKKFTEAQEGNLGQEDKPIPKRKMGEKTHDELAPGTSGETNNQTSNSR